MHWGSYIFLRVGIWKKKTVVPHIDEEVNFTGKGGKVQFLETTRRAKNRILLEYYSSLGWVATITFCLSIKTLSQNTTGVKPFKIEAHFQVFSKNKKYSVELLFHCRRMAWMAHHDENHVVRSIFWRR